MAGSISLSLSQQFDELGRPLNAGKIYFIQAGTTATPQNAYQDSALTLSWPNPITLDAAGRVPQLFFADGNIKVRITDAAGVNQLVADNILVVGASSGGGGGGSVDPTTVLQTGWLQAIYGTGVIPGFVRANGRTIGNVGSGATERANADTQSLFVFLYGQDANLAVSGGRGASAAADYAASKTIALPDWRGRALAFLDDMGNTAAGRLTSTYFAAATVLGASGGSQSHALTLGETPSGIAVSGVNAISVFNPSPVTMSGSNSITASGTNSITASGTNSIIVTSTVSDVLRATVHDNFASIAGDNGPIHTVTGNTITSTGNNSITVANAAQNITVANAAQFISVSASGGAITSTGNNTITGTSTNTGGAAHSIVPPMMLATIYVKL